MVALPLSLSSGGGSVPQSGKLRDPHCRHALDHHLLRLGQEKYPFSRNFAGLSFGLVPLGVWLAMEPAGFLKTGPGLHPAVLVLSAMICITDWGFTNCDASRDVAGDREEGIPTMPVTFGIPATAKIVAVFWLIGVLLSLALGLLGDLGMALPLRRRRCRRLAALAYTGLRSQSDR